MIVDLLCKDHPWELDMVYRDMLNNCVLFINCIAMQYITLDYIYTVVTVLFRPGDVFRPPGHITCQYLSTDYLLCLCFCVDIPGTAGALGDPGREHVE